MQVTIVVCSILLLAIAPFGFIFTRENPFVFANEQQQVPNKPISYEPELKGISVCQETGVVLAVIKYKHELFTVGLGELVKQWRVYKITKDYVALVDQEGNEKKLDFKE